MERQLRLIGGEEAFERAGRRGGVRVGDVEGQAVPEQAGGAAEDQGSLGQGFTIDLEVGEAPGKGRKGRDPELGRVFQESILDLEVLRCEEDTFAPEHTLGLTHA